MARISRAKGVRIHRLKGIPNVSQLAGPLVLYIRPLRQVFCSLSWLPSASSVPWFSSASAAWPSAPSSGACRSFPCGRRSVLNAGSDLQPICLALNHPARLLTIRSFSQRTVYFLLPRSVTPYADWASKWLSCFQSRKSSTASLRATAVRARLAPQRLTIEAPVTVVSRQLAAS